MLSRRTSEAKPLPHPAVLQPQAADSKLPPIDDAFIRSDKVFSYGVYCVPNAAVLDFIRPCGPFLEIGAGAALWTALIRNRGGDSLAIDLPGPNRWKNIVEPARFAEVELLPAQQAVLKYPERTPLAVWPCPDVPWLAETLLALAPGRRVLVLSDEIERELTHLDRLRAGEKAYPAVAGAAVAADVLDREFELLATSESVPHVCGPSHMKLWRRRVLH